MSLNHCAFANWGLSVVKISLFALFIVFTRAAFVSGQPKLINLQDDKMQLESFIDGIISEQLQVYHIAGATVTIVKDGNVLLMKGYGYSDILNHKKVAADKTLFRIGGVSQLITTTAIMQLYDKQKVSLNSDVNGYFKFLNIPNTFKEPVTLEDILTRTTGFEQRFNMFTKDYRDLKPLNEYLKNNIPVRIRPPGKLAGDSDFAMGLAGYIVEQITNTSFETYVQENIFQPLQMNSSTFAQPLPKEKLDQLSDGYTFKNGLFEKDPIPYIKVPPAGSMYTTAKDMSRFMITLLHNGLYDTTRIMSAKVAQQMQHRHFIHDPEVSGNCYGFWERYINNQRVIMSTGNSYVFHSLLALVPDFDLGIFISFNSYGGEKACSEFLQIFMDHYYSGNNAANIVPMKDYKQRSYRYLGNYWSTETSYSTIGKLLQLDRTVSIHSTPKGYLLVHGLKGGASQWVEIRPTVFQDLNSNRRLVFHSTNEGSVNYAFLSNNPTTAYYRIAWYESPEFHVTLTSICLMVFLSFILFWPFSRGYQREYEMIHVIHNIKFQNLTFQTALWLSLIDIIFVAGLYIILKSPETLAFDIPLSLKLLLILPVISTILTIIDLILMLLAWKDLYWDIRSRIHFSMVILAAATFIPILMFWNLLGFHY